MLLPLNVTVVYWDIRLCMYAVQGYLFDIIIINSDVGVPSLIYHKMFILSLSSIRIAAAPQHIGCRKIAMQEIVNCEWNERSNLLKRHQTVSTCTHTHTHTNMEKHRRQ